MFPTADKYVSDLDPIIVYGSKNRRAPEHIPGIRSSTEPFKPFRQLFCTFLDINEQCVMIGGEGSFLGGLIIVSCGLMALLNRSAAFLFDGRRPASRKSSRMSSGKTHPSAIWYRSY